MKAVATHVYPDEPCFGLFEGPMIVPQPDGSRPWRWCQQVRVARGDHLAYYVEDLGPAGDYERITPLYMPSWGDDSVAQLREHAEKNRHDDFWARRVDEMLAGSTLIEDAMRHNEQRRDLLLNRSVIGPAVSVQRNGTPRQEAIRKYREERDARRGYTAH